METKDKTYLGIIGVIGILIAGGVYLTEDELNSAYICLASDEVGIFYGGISGTGLSAYPYSENRTDVERCYTLNGDKSTWVKLIDYLEEQGISLDEFLQPKEITQQNIGKSYLCSVGGCVEK